MDFTLLSGGTVPTIVGYINAAWITLTSILPGWKTLVTILFGPLSVLAWKLFEKTSLGKEIAVKKYWKEREAEIEQLLNKSRAFRNDLIKVMGEIARLDSLDSPTRLDTLVKAYLESQRDLLIAQLNLVPAEAVGGLALPDSSPLNDLPDWHTANDRLP